MYFRDRDANEQKRIEHKYGRHFPNVRQARAYEADPDNKTLQELRSEKGTGQPYCLGCERGWPQEEGIHVPGEDKALYACRRATIQP